MDLNNYNDICLVLNIKDRRDRKVRAAEVRDIKIKVWTQRPDCSLTFGYYDILQKKDTDTLVISPKVMEALTSGVVSYKYTYKIVEKDIVVEDEETDEITEKHEHHKKHKEPKYFEKIVVTDYFWKNKFREGIIESPVFYHIIGELKDVVYGEKDLLETKVEELDSYVKFEYTNNLNDEITRSTEKDDELQFQIDELDNRVDDNYEELKGLIEQGGNGLTSTNEDLKRIEGKLDEEISRSTGEDEKMKKQLEDEISRISVSQKEVKTYVEVLETKVDNNTNLIQNETSRAELVEKDLAGSLQTLKEKVKTNESEIIDIRNEVVKETQRAEFEEQNIKNSLSVLNGDENTIGSLNHVLKDAKHYTDDEVEKFKLQVEEGFLARLETLEDEFEWAIYE